MAELVSKIGSPPVPSRSEEPLRPAGPLGEDDALAEGTAGLTAELA